MKKFILLMVVAAFGSTSSAWVETSPQSKEYNFKFKLKTDTFTYTRTAPSYEEAFESAAQACFKNFKAGRHVSEDQGLDIIDTCANPRTI